MGIALAECGSLDLVLLEVEMLALAPHVEGARVTHGNLEMHGKFPAWVGAHEKVPFWRKGEERGREGGGNGGREER